MTSRHDRLCLRGLDSPSVMIGARELHEVLSALPATSGLTMWVLESEPGLFHLGGMDLPGRSAGG